MPTLYKAEMSDTATSWVQLWDRMHEGLQPNARQILIMLGYYAERDLDVPTHQTPLSRDEETELLPIASALTIAAVESQAMRDGVTVATLTKVAKAPHSFACDLPAAVQWEMALDYQRGGERPGAFAMDIWGTDQTRVPYVFGQPTEENIARAAERAARRIQEGRSHGRPQHPAHTILAERLGPIFRSSGHPIVRRREKQLRREHGAEVVVWVETGPFHDFLELVLCPLKDFLRERRLPPMTIESIVRNAIAHGKHGHA